MTDEERAVIETLAEAASLFFALPMGHPSDTGEFQTGVHALQNIVAARATARENRDLFFWPEEA